MRSFAIVVVDGIGERMVQDCVVGLMVGVIAQFATFRCERGKFADLCELERGLVLDGLGIAYWLVDQAETRSSYGVVPTLASHNLLVMATVIICLVGGEEAVRPAILNSHLLCANVSFLTPSG